MFIREMAVIHFSTETKDRTNRLQNQGFFRLSEKEEEVASLLHFAPLQSGARVFLLERAPFHWNGFGKERQKAFVS